MSSWIVITPAHLADYLVAAQVAALRSAALGAGQLDPFAQVMQDRCGYVRNRIGKRIAISATPYAVPPELKEQACLLIIESMQGRIPALSLTDDQVRRINRAYRDLDIAATDNFPISLPDDPVEPAVQRDQGGGLEIIRTQTGAISTASMRGL